MRSTAACTSAAVNAPVQSPDGFCGRMCSIDAGSVSASLCLPTPLASSSRRQRMYSRSFLRPRGLSEWTAKRLANAPSSTYTGRRCAKTARGRLAFPARTAFAASVIDGFQRVRVAAADLIPERHDAGQLQDAIEVIRGEPLPGGEEHRRHLPGAEQDQVANVGSGFGSVLPVFVARIGKRGVELRSFLERVEQIEDLRRCVDAVANQLEQSLLPNPGLLAEKVVAKGIKYRKHLQRRALDRGSPRGLGGLLSWTR